MNCSNKNHCVPKFVAQSIEIDQTANTAIIKVCGELPECPGYFNVCLLPCPEQTCSSAKVSVKDSCGVQVRVFNLKANEATLGQVSVQAARHGILHLVRSTDLPHNALWLDNVKCVATPVVPVTSYSVASVSTAKTSTVKETK